MECKGGRREPTETTTVIIQAREDGHSNWHDSSEDGKKGSEFGCILKAESTEFPDKVDVKCERKVLRMMSKFWLSNWKDGVAINQGQKDYGEETIGYTILERRKVVLVYKYELSANKYLKSWDWLRVTDGEKMIKHSALGRRIFIHDENWLLQGNYGYPCRERLWRQ